MANKVLAFFENAEKKTEVVAVDVAKGSADAIKLLFDVKALSPAFKAAVSQLITDAEDIATASVSAGSQSGVNVVADIAVATATSKLVKDFIAFLPVLEADAKLLAADVK